MRLILGSLNPYSIRFIVRPNPVRKSLGTEPALAQRPRTGETLIKVMTAAVEAGRLGGGRGDSEEF